MLLSRPQDSRRITDQAELARIGHVSRARLTQIMDLNLLSPGIQEEIILCEIWNETKETCCEHDLRGIAAEYNWKLQRERRGETKVQYAYIATRSKLIT